MAKKRRASSFEARKARYGFYFIVPWLFGMATFFLLPLVKSIWYSLSDVYFDMDGALKTDFVLFSNFKYLFNVDPDFINNLRDSIVTFSYKLPVIVILSLLFSIMLNQKFKGRLFMRSLFFLPVIIASGVVMEKITGFSGARMSVSGSVNNVYASGTSDLQQILINLNFSDTVVAILLKYIFQIFNLIWSTGVQTILFISGLQTIPAQLYEVSKVEGATKWEEFWFITVPMLRNIIFLVMVYTIIDLFVTVDSPVVGQAYALLDSLQYGLSSSMLWMYFVIAGTISGVLLFLYNRLCIRKWE